MAIGDWIREIIAGTVGSVIGQKVRQGGSSPDDDQRAGLFLLFQELPPDAAAVMWRRHQEAAAKLRENQFVAALAKIPNEQRKEAVIRLAQMNDADFQQALALLSPDMGRVGEATKRLQEHIDDALQPLNERLKAKEEKLKKQIEEESRGLKRWTSLFKW